MFGIESLDVMIGIITVYLIFALACTAIVEAISASRNVRSKNLEDALKEFLHGNLTKEGSFVDAFFAHPVVQSLSKGVDGRPSYINPEIVGQVVTNLIYTKEKTPTLKQAIDNLPGTTQNNRIKGLLGSLQDEAKEDMAAFRKLIETHYDAAMDRASGWYKRYTQKAALYISAVLVISANVDTINLANSLSSNPAARAKMVEIAQQQLSTARDTEKQVAQDKEAAAAKPVASSTNSGSGGSVPSDPLKEVKDRTEDAAKALATANANLSSAGIQLGWKGSCPINLSPSDLASKLVGLLISILAISLGAPFWFDVLNRVMQIRAAGVSPRDKKPTVT